MCQQHKNNKTMNEIHMHKINGLPERLHQHKVHLSVNWLKIIKLSTSVAYKNRLHYAQHLNTYIYSSANAV